MKILIVIQARMGSSRLPGKILKPLGNSVVLDYVVSRCRQVKQVMDVIVATSTLKQDTPVVDWCNENRVTCFRGSEDDVLSRYYECAKPYKPDYVVRVTADCPFVDYDLADQVIMAMSEKPSDLVAVESPLPRGLVVEMVSFKALEYMHEHGHEPRHREHVTYYATEFPEEFERTLIEAPALLRHPELRITLDTEEDYQLCTTVAEYFDRNQLVSSQEVVDYLLANPDVAEMNAHIEQKPVK